MKRIIAAAAIAVAFGTASAHAQERAGDAVLGAVSGALVLGPVGAAAGAVIGYTAGPGIARSWGIGGHRRQRGVRRTGRGRAASNAPAPAASGAESATEGSKKRGNWYNVTR